MEPLLFKYRRKCNFVKRSDVRKVMEKKYEYDKDRSVMVIVEDGKKIPLVLSNNHEVRLTKKKDIETGEDEKDMWMWK